MYSCIFTIEPEFLLLRVDCNLAGVAVIFAQFESVDQFRAIGWYNVAYGVALLFLLLFIFRGESSCKKMDQKSFKSPCCNKQSNPDFCLGPLSIFISCNLRFYSVYLHACMVENLEQLDTDWLEKKGFIGKESYM